MDYEKTSSCVKFRFVLKGENEMKLKILKRGLAVLLCAGIAAGGILTVNYSFADTISDARSEIQRIKSERSAMEKELSNYQAGKDDIMSSIEKLDGKISAVTKNMVNIREKVKKNRKNIKELEKKIQYAEADIENQYDTMKKRIKYMYENGSSGYIEILLDSDSLSDLLNRSEYIEKISQYDSNMLTNFVNAKNELEVKKQNLQDRREILLEEKNELNAQNKTLNKIMDKKQSELDTYNANISDAQQQIGEYSVEIEKQDRIIENALLEEQRRIAREERARKEAEAKAKEQEQNQNKEQKEEDDSDSEEPDTGTVSAGGFRWPLPVSGKITSPFGSRTSPTQGASTYHQGIDIAAPAGTAVLAAKSGTVVTASYSSVSGNYVMINHGDGVFTVYMHASSLAVSKGQQVSAGATIAYVGSTGVSTGSHLHFGVSVGGNYVNPLNYVSR